jgi:transmembrane sensor
MVTWTSGEFYFNKAPLKDVFKEIERQFNVEIVYSSSENRLYTGYFNKKDLNDALRLVCIPMEVNYSVNERTIEIKQIKSK